jgi:hypothetical protein
MKAKGTTEAQRTQRTQRRKYTEAIGRGKRRRGFAANGISHDYLVPKLCLGTHVAKLCFASASL